MLSSSSSIRLCPFRGIRGQSVCVSVIQGTRVWVKEKEQLVPATVNSCGDGPLVVTTDYGEGCENIPFPPFAERLSCMAAVRRGAGLISVSRLQEHQYIVSLNRPSGVRGGVMGALQSASRVNTQAMCVREAEQKE
ncbi:Unconventional myosin-X [Liparis tanakae]|uniref:Unconventional myosin-X n=1 Tax=Liparis tanakae TaxID=230148 RepID=A0A4Z2G5P0_9TELE|nr:Unconventional myosin-X [Liparis tanakae]